jgi:hypothetical protein
MADKLRADVHVKRGIGNFGLSGEAHPLVVSLKGLTVFAELSKAIHYA